MNDLPFKFPVFTIPGLDPAKWWEIINVYANEDEFTRLERRNLKNPEELGRIVVDAKGRSWRLLSVKELGVDARNLWQWLYFSAFGSRRVKYELSEELHLSFEEIKESICTAIRAKPDSWRDDEALAGEGGEEPRDEQEMLEELLGKIRAAKNSLNIIAVINAHGED